MSDSWQPRPVLITVFVYALLALIVHWRTQATPTALGIDVEPARFSEGRAKEHVQRLTEGGRGRLVSHPGMESSILYLLHAARNVAAIAESRPDLHVQVELQSVTGAVHMLFLESVIGNAYQNLSNIVLTIRPSELGSSKGLLVASHFDSVIGSPGASDCGSQVGVMLEAARVLVTAPHAKLRAPVVFLFNGGEETFSQAAHGFMAKYDQPLGAFINLESTGPGGPDYVFQHTGAWTIAAYARAAKHPRGAVIGQDIFETGLLPADSDFRMFSYKHYGTLPGLDVAFLLDGAAYHTDRDTVARLRSGTLQAMGDNLVAAVPEFTRILAEHAAAPESHPDSKAIYFDVLGAYMVVYSMKLASMLHSIPIALVLAMPLVTSRRSASVQRPTYKAIFRGSLVYGLSSAAAVLAPVMLGLLRVLLSGRPMVWYAHHSLAFLMYVPVSLCALLAVQSWGQAALHVRLDNALLGMAALLGGLAAVMTSLKLGSAFLLAAWAMAALLGMPTIGKEHRTSSLLRALACAVMPIVFSLPLAFLLANILMDKTSMMGVLPPPIGPAAADMIVGAVVGLATAVSAGSMGPWISSLTSHRRIRVYTGVLLVVSIVVAVAASSAASPYSMTSPKRVLLQHIFQQGADGSIVADRLAIGSSDPVVVDKALNLIGLQRLPDSVRDWETLYPLSLRLGGVAAKPQLPSQPPFSLLPTMVLVSRETGTVSQRLHLQLRTGAPCWGVMNMTGGIVAWSFADGLPHSSLSQEGKPEQVIRIAGGKGSDNWEFWVDLDPHGQLQIDVSVTFWDRTTAAMDKIVADRMPSWTTILAGITLQSQWSFGFATDS